MLAKLPQGLYRELVAGELSEITGIATERLLGQLETGAAPHAPAPAVAARRSKPPGRTVMQKAISLLLHFPEAGAAAAEIEGLAEIDAPGADLLKRLLEITAADPKITTGQLIETFRDESEGRWIEQLAREDPLDDEAAAPLVLRDSLLRIVEAHRRRAQAEAIRGRSGHAAPP
jgi:DNA primase